MPLFFYLLQWPLAHSVAIAVSLLAGKDVGYYFISPPAFFTEAPPNAGFELGMVYACWAARRRRALFPLPLVRGGEATAPTSLLRYL